MDPTDKFTELYQKARKEKKQEAKTREEIEFEMQKEECTFEPNIKTRKSSTKKDHATRKNMEARKDSAQNSNPEITTNFKIDQRDIDFVNQKIEELEEQKHDGASDVLNKELELEQSPREPSNQYVSPARFNEAFKLHERVTVETPKTEELEEEMRDQVLDYQNPNIYNTNIPVGLSDEINMLNNMSPEEHVEYIDNDPDADDNPLLFVDVNLGPDKAERIVVFEGDTAEDLATRFSQRHNLNEIMKFKLTQLLESEIAGLNQENS